MSSKSTKPHLPIGRQIKYLSVYSNILSQECRYFGGASLLYLTLYKQAAEDYASLPEALWALQEQKIKCLKEDFKIDASKHAMEKLEAAQEAKKWLESASQDYGSCKWVRETFQLSSQPKVLTELAKGRIFRGI